MIYYFFSYSIHFSTWMVHDTVCILQNKSAILFPPSHLRSALSLQAIFYLFFHSSSLWCIQQWGREGGSCSAMPSLSLIREREREKSRSVSSPELFDIRLRPECFSKSSLFARSEELFHVFARVQPCYLSRIIIGYEWLTCSWFLWGVKVIRKDSKLKIEKCIAA